MSEGLETERRSAGELIRRCVLLSVSLAVMACGVAVSIKAGLGTSPISSLPYVLSCVTPLTVGTATIAMHVALILLQIVLLRRRYQPVQLLQLPVALLFGVLCDAAVWMLRDVAAVSYAGKLALCAVGILLVGIGVSLEVAANVIVLAGEGVVLAVCKVSNIRFPAAKVGFDVSLVLIASALSLLSLGTLVGVREGTAAAAVCVGLVAKQSGRLLQKPLQRLLHG